MKTQTYKIAGIVVAILALLGLAIGLNPQLFQGFIISFQPNAIENKCDAECGRLQNEALRAMISQGVEVDGAVAFQNIDFNIIRDKLTQVNAKCGCNGMRDVFMKGLNSTLQDTDAFLENLGFNCSGEVYVVNSDICPQASSCQQRANDIIARRLNGSMSDVEFKTQLIGMYNGTKGEKCSCDFYFDIFDGLGYSIQEANRFAAQSDVIKCFRQVPQFSCEEGINAAFDEIERNPENAWQAVQQNLVEHDCSCKDIEELAQRVDRQGLTVAEYLNSIDHAGCPANTPPITPDPTPVTCPEQKRTSIQALTGEISFTSPYTEVEKMKAAGCECEDIIDMARQLGYTTEVEINNYLEQADQIECQIPVPDDTPSCENYRQQAFDSLQRYRQFADHQDLADALEAMLRLDTQCCDFCGATPGDDGGFIQVPGPRATDNSESIQVPGPRTDGFY